MRIILILALCLNLNAQIKRVFYSKFMYNHSTLYAEPIGMNELTENESKKIPHYVFYYNSRNQTIKIINNNYSKVRRHPLTHFNVHRIEIEYKKDKIIRTFYDIKGRPMENLRGVYKEVYELDDSGVKKGLKFYDQDDQPMESIWHISDYVWEQNGDLIIEKRYNLKGEFQNISPYFEFGITGHTFYKNGFPKQTFNLDNDLNVTNNSLGIASYFDTYDTYGNHIQYEYRDKSGKKTNSPWGFGYGRKEYTSNHELFKTTRYKLNGEVMNSNFATPPKPKEMSKKDREEVENIARHYLDALITMSPKLMEKVVHKNINKYTSFRDFRSRKDSLRQTTYSDLIGYAKRWNGSGIKFPPNPNIEVTILDTYDRMATVKLVSDNWYEYLHIVKLNDEWKILNLFWRYNH